MKLHGGAGNLQGTELDNVLEDYRDKLEDGVAEFYVPI